MLVLTRKKGERIQLGDTVTLTVLEIRGTTVRLGFEAPATTPIHREEVYKRIRGEGPLGRSGRRRKELKAG